MHGQTPNTSDQATSDHAHVFLGPHHERNARAVWMVVTITVVMMVIEIAGGTLLGSLALVADGWHMSTHAAALTISALAYAFAKAHVHDTRFAFGTGKIGDLGGFVSAILLALIALFIVIESIERFFAPAPFAYGEAILIALLGFAVNIASGLILRHDPEHHHHHAGHSHHLHLDCHDGAHGQDYDHDHDHGQVHAHHHDLNLRAAYIHVLADAVTSLLTVAGLLIASWQNWPIIDPLIGFAGAAVILSWSFGLMRQAGAVLLDLVPSSRLVQAVRARLEVEGDRVCDLHVWQIGPGHYAVEAALITDNPKQPQFYKDKLDGIFGLSHISIEVNRR